MTALKSLTRAGDRQAVPARPAPVIAARAASPPSPRPPLSPESQTETPRRPAAGSAAPVLVRTTGEPPRPPATAAAPSQTAGPDQHQTAEPLPIPERPEGAGLRDLFARVANGDRGTLALPADRSRWQALRDHLPATVLVRVAPGIAGGIPDRARVIRDSARALAAFVVKLAPGERRTLIAGRPVLNRLFERVVVSGCLGRLIPRGPLRPALPVAVAVEPARPSVVFERARTIRDGARELAVFAAKLAPGERRVLIAGRPILSRLFERIMGGERYGHRDLVSVRYGWPALRDHLHTTLRIAVEPERARLITERARTIRDGAMALVTPSPIGEGWLIKGRPLLEGLFGRARMFIHHRRGMMAFDAFRRPAFHEHIRVTVLILLEPGAGAGHALHLTHGIRNAARDLAAFAAPRPHALGRRDRFEHHDARPEPHHAHAVEARDRSHPDHGSRPLRAHNLVV